MPADSRIEPLSRDGDAGLAQQLAGRYAERIRQRLLGPGARLPSVRECARRHAISTHTVVAAYDQLLALGLVEARRQRGFFVRESASAPAPLRRAKAGTASSRPPLPVDATTLVRGMFQPPGALPMPSSGTLPVEWLDVPMLASALRRIAGGSGLAETALRYGEPAGEPRLREALAQRLAEHAIPAGPTQIVTTLGAIHALDIATRTLARPGDSVLVDEPGWSIEYARLAALGLRVLPVPRGPEGVDLDVMERLIEAHRPRLYVTVSVLHNPTGASLGLATAHRLLRIAQAHDLTIVEDDTYAHLAPPHLPRLAALDGLERTVYIGGFSKILAPGWRVGFMAVAPGLVDRMVDTKLLTSLTTPGLTERAIALCLESGQLRLHAGRVQDKLEAARARTVRLARAHGCRFESQPNGLFGWVDVGVDTQRLARNMLERGWLIAPGALFHAVPRPTRLMRINFASSQDPRFWKALARERDGMAASVGADDAR
ncbi:MAG: PLP-dependent aminotransferase family protein [Burkholderiaceae bacterium]